MMADPVSLALGLAPIVGGIVKSYQVVYRKLRVFGRAHREVDRIRKQLDRQRHVFVNETHLLLRLVIDDDEEQIEAMVSDGDHEQWTSPKLSRLFQTCFTRSSESFREIVEDVGANMNYLLKELECFEGLDQGDEEARVKLKERVQRLRSAAKIAFDKTRCDQAIQNLRTANDDLKRLREQAQDLRPSKLQPDNNRRSEVAPKIRPSYACCGKIRRAAKALHEGLSKTLPSHYHDVRLFLEATVVEENTITDLAILCESQEAVSRSIVQVRSRPVDWLPTPPQTPEDSPEAGTRLDSPRKRRKVRWSDQQAEPEICEQLKLTEEKLHLAQDLCLEICRAGGCGGERTEAKECVCYVETCLDQTFRHEFYSYGGNYHHPTELATFDDILHHPAETSISLVDQLKLARTVVSAVLYFSSTPWLAEYWGMKDLCFFLNRDDLSTTLRTLNLGVRFLGSVPPDLQGTIEDGTMDGIDCTSFSRDSRPAVDEAMLVYGIRNMTLHSLGVVLLQIGRWNRIEPDDILQVRRLAQRVPRLGPKYQDLTQKCLDCDFGRGSNLTRPQLQQAVYEDVVEELGAMIKCLDISSDDGQL
jgi:hypothetical protein